MCTCGVAKLLSQLNRFQITVSFSGNSGENISLLHVDIRDKIGDNGKTYGSPTFQFISLYF